MRMYSQILTFSSVCVQCIVFEFLLLQIELFFLRNAIASNNSALHLIWILSPPDTAYAHLKNLSLWGLLCYCKYQRMFFALFKNALCFIPLGMSNFPGHAVLTTLEISRIREAFEEYSSRKRREEIIRKVRVEVLQELMMHALRHYLSLYSNLISVLEILMLAFFFYT